MKNKPITSEDILKTSELLVKLEKKQKEELKQKKLEKIEKKQKEELKEKKVVLQKKTRRKVNVLNKKTNIDFNLFSGSDIPWIGDI